VVRRRLLFVSPTVVVVVSPEAVSAPTVVVFSPFCLNLAFVCCVSVVGEGKDNIVGCLCCWWLCGDIFVVVFSLLWWLYRGCLYLAGGVVGFGVGRVVLFVLLVSFVLFVLFGLCCVGVVLLFSCNWEVILVWFLNCSVMPERVWCVDAPCWR